MPEGACHHQEIKEDLTRKQILFCIENSDDINEEEDTQGGSALDWSTVAKYKKTSVTEILALNLDRKLQSETTDQQQPNSNPATWRQLTRANRDLLVLNGVPKTLPNGEKVCRDWIKKLKNYQNATGDLIKEDFVDKI
ncbi:unnamed protein product [Caretta caretta]